MPLPLPIMIPFMMWQSAAIAAGFGTYFQYAKRRVSAMSNEEFNKSNPHDLVNAMYDELIVAMPSSFKKIETLTPIILDSMLKMLTDAADWFSQVLGGGGLPDIQHHIAGLPGHVGHTVLGTPGEDSSGEPSDGGTTPPPGGERVTGTIIYTLAEVKAMSDSTIQALKQKIVEGNHVMDKLTVELVEDEWNLRFNPPRGQGIPYTELDNNAKNFQDAVTVEAFPTIGKIRINALKQLRTATEILNMTNAWYANNRGALDRARGATAIAHFQKEGNEILTLIRLRNKWLSDGKSFSL